MFKIFTSVSFCKISSQVKEAWNEQRLFSAKQVHHFLTDPDLKLMFWFMDVVTQDPDESISTVFEIHTSQSGI